MSESSAQARLKAKCSVLYALGIYLPFSNLARAARARSRALRGKPNRHQQDTQLPEADRKSVV